MPRVAEVTGSEKSPPGGETAPTIVTEPSRSGFPMHFTCTRPTRIKMMTMMIMMMKRMAWCLEPKAKLSKGSFGTSAKSARLSRHDHFSKPHLALIYCAARCKRQQ